jgi:hypothetical protein
MCSTFKLPLGKRRAAATREKSFGQTEERGFGRRLVDRTVRAHNTRISVALLRSEGNVKVLHKDAPGIRET